MQRSTHLESYFGTEETLWDVSICFLKVSGKLHDSQPTQGHTLVPILVLTLESNKMTRSGENNEGKYDKRGKTKMNKLN